MAQLWVMDPVAAADRPWAILALGGDGHALRLDASPPVLDSKRGAQPLLVRAAGADGGEAWAVLAGAPAAALVNGLPVSVGIRVVADRDEIRVPGVGRFFFSTERLAGPEPFPAGREPVFCPRCRKAIESGSLAIRCPRCGVWHHHAAPGGADSAAEAMSCWTYTETCAMCDQPTALDAGFQWTPEGL